MDVEGPGALRVLPDDSQWKQLTEKVQCVLQ
jgi:hypothetical protein